MKVERMIMPNKENDCKEGIDYNFYNYLISRGYFFDKRTIENYLLSLKVKQFAILTGNSGTGKTKLSQLFAEYCLLYKSFLKLDGDEGFVTIQVSTTKSSYKDIDNQGRKINPGWTPRHEKLKEFLSLDKILGEHEIQLGNISKNATILLSTRLFYERDCIEFKEHFKSIFDTGDVFLKVSNGDIISCINPFFNYSDEFKIKLNLMKDVDAFDGVQLLPKEFLQYTPLKECRFKIYTDDFKHEANANIRFEFRINFDNDEETKEYLKSINGDKYELTIKGFKNNFYELSEIVPVSANWTENRNVVGYYNVLTKEYQHTPSLDLILKAQNHTDEPFFLILDEMNLSHVERYFSDFLSSMESGKPIPLHKADDVDDVPNVLTIPPNVFIVGTVNVDETTYMFSPKVLDRANVIEFKTFEELSITDYIFNNSSNVEFGGDVDYLENPLSDNHLRENILSEVNGEFSQVRHTLEVFKSEGDVNTFINEEFNLLDYIIEELSKFNGYLEGSGFEFGYRTVNEILAFMYVSWKYEGEQEVWDNWRRYFDAQILQKILPKLHGSQIVLGETLDNLLTHCLGVDSVDEINDLSKLDLNELNAPYLESAKKLIQMKNVLEKQRYVSFIN